MRGSLRTLRQSGVLRGVLALGILLFCTAPTPGDVGACGQRALPLDPEGFFVRKKATDCEKCRDCEFETEFCEAACSPDEVPPDSFPEGCEPLVHDGLVCLNALDAAGCGEYEEYAKDQGREVPNECRFCPWEAP